MTDREILDKYINFEDSCLTKWEKQKLRDIIYDYKDAFSLRDKIDTCPNIKVELDVMDNSPFFIGPLTLPSSYLTLKVYDRSGSMYFYVFMYW